MLAATVRSIDQLHFPLIATPKIDGIRCVTLPLRDDSAADDHCCEPMCRSLKPVPNRHARRLLSRLPPGLDGELMVRLPDGRLAPFYRTQSDLMRHDGEPQFEYHVFDRLMKFHSSEWTRGVMTRYSDRLRDLETGLQFTRPSFVKIVPHKLLHDRFDLEEYESLCLLNGHEGVMLRAPHSPYKFGKSTMREQWLMSLRIGGVGKLIF